MILTYLYNPFFTTQWKNTNTLVSMNSCILHAETKLQNPNEITDAVQISFNHLRGFNSTHPSRRILRVRSSHRFLVSTKMIVLFSFSAIISSINWINLRKENKQTFYMSTFTGLHNAHTGPLIIKIWLKFKLRQVKNSLEKVTYH